MSQHDHLLKQLCGSSSETLARARELLYIATVRTAPGTGFQLKDPLGRPAACALIASEQLKNTVVDPAIRAALAHNASHQPSDHTKRRQMRFEFISQISYDSLVAKYALLQTYGDRFVSWCHRAEFAFFDLGKGHNIALDSPKIKLGIFFWVCGILEPDRLDLASFVENNGAHTEHTGWITIMDIYGSKIRAPIVSENHGKQLSVPNHATGPPKALFPPSTSPRKSPSKQSMNARPKTQALAYNKDEGQLA
ncbi:hypothetical protein F5890DRAFT_1476871 [Lentinula detonsa]|uniref:Uncharacterized protein n=1 Tax=Lentinula detonsa TaxID=2804962 RepID=A0AA38PTW4_9AGAR|nr:hypothetical protein F5890DRAFT_1476871 [Lentinula detonsa]